MPARSASWRPWACIQRLSEVRMRAAAQRTSSVSGTSQNPSRKPRTAVSAASRPPLSPPMPSASAATTSRRSSPWASPTTAPTKSSLRLRSPFSDAKPMLTFGSAAVSVTKVPASSNRYRTKGRGRGGGSPPRPSIAVSGRNLAAFEVVRSLAVDRVVADLEHGVRHAQLDEQADQPEQHERHDGVEHDDEERGERLHLE